MERSGVDGELPAFATSKPALRASRSYGPGPSLYSNMRGSVPTAKRRVTLLPSEYTMLTAGSRPAPSISASPWWLTTGSLTASLVWKWRPCSRLDPWLLGQLGPLHPPLWSLEGRGRGRLRHRQARVGRAGGRAASTEGSAVMGTQSTPESASPGTDGSRPAS